MTVSTWGRGRSEGARREAQDGRFPLSGLCVGPLHLPFAVGSLQKAVDGPRRSGGIGRRASLRGWCPQGRGGSSPPSDTNRCSIDLRSDRHRDVTRCRSAVGRVRSLSVGGCGQFVEDRAHLLERFRRRPTDPRIADCAWSGRPPEHRCSRSAVGLRVQGEGRRTGALKSQALRAQRLTCTAISY